MKKYMLIIIFIVSSLFIASCTEADQTANQKHGEKTSKEIAVSKNLPSEPLHKMDKGEDVEVLQKILINIGYSIEVTGMYDEQTTWAITDIQLQNDNVESTGFYDKQTKKIIKDILDNKITIIQEEGLAAPTLNGQTNEDDVNLIENPHDALVLINRENRLPADYIPHDLIIPDVRFPFTEDVPKMQLRVAAAKALEELFTASDEAGLSLFAQSGYRSYDRQDTIFTSHVTVHGEETANTFSARPGESEHQSGLAMDVTSPEVDYLLDEAFEETAEGKWIQEHASRFGFIIRYPKGKETITKYRYEPWHLRYVGKEAAKKITENDLTLEEFLQNK